MKIKFLLSVGGPHYSYAAGDIVDAEAVPFGDGPRFLEAGIAEPVQEERTKATVKAPHRAVKE